MWYLSRCVAFFLKIKNVGTTRVRWRNVPGSGLGRGTVNSVAVKQLSQRRQVSLLNGPTVLLQFSVKQAVGRRPLPGCDGHYNTDAVQVLVAQELKCFVVFKGVLRLASLQAGHGHLIGIVGGHNDNSNRRVVVGRVHEALSHVRVVLDRNLQLSWLHNDTSFRGDDGAHTVDELVHAARRRVALGNVARQEPHAGLGLGLLHVGHHWVHQAPVSAHLDKGLLLLLRAAVVADGDGRRLDGDLASVEGVGAAQAKVGSVQQQHAHVVELRAFHAAVCCDGTAFCRTVALHEGGTSAPAQLLRESQKMLRCRGAACRESFHPRSENVAREFGQRTLPLCAAEARPGFLWNRLFFVGFIRRHLRLQRLGEAAGQVGKGQERVVQPGPDVRGTRHRGGLDFSNLLEERRHRRRVVEHLCLLAGLVCRPVVRGVEAQRNTPAHRHVLPQLVPVRRVRQGDVRHGVRLARCLPLLRVAGDVGHEAAPADSDKLRQSRRPRRRQERRDPGAAPLHSFGGEHVAECDVVAVALYPVVHERHRDAVRRRLCNGAAPVIVGRQVHADHRLQRRCLLHKVLHTPRLLRVVRLVVAKQVGHSQQRDSP
eukprot:Rhum_TRINITY_DN5630_c0_g1::Rhum_TRINITY_DN5630_c0_g1_i1::g.17966::m.17966